MRNVSLNFLFLIVSLTVSRTVSITVLRKVSQAVSCYGLMRKQVPVGTTMRTGSRLMVAEEEEEEQEEEEVVVVVC